MNFQFLKAKCVCPKWGEVSFYLQRFFPFIFFIILIYPSFSWENFSASSVFPLLRVQHVVWECCSKKKIFPSLCARNSKLRTENTDIKKKHTKKTPNQKNKLKMSTEEKWQKYLLVLLISCMTFLLTTSTLAKKVLSKSTICPSF